jgi:hypothetical protein
MYNIMSILVTIMTVVTMCSPLKGPYVSPELQPAYEEWIEGCKSRKIPWKREVARMDSILFNPLEEGYWGKCYGDKIVVNSEDIEPNDTFLIKLIMFHELGHCAFGYTHDDMGIAIMNTYLPSDKIIAYRWFWELLEEQYYSQYQLPKTRRRLSECTDE